jgi:hypothetical protein
MEKSNMVSLADISVYILCLDNNYSRFFAVGLMVSLGFQKGTSEIQSIAMIFGEFA